MSKIKWLEFRVDKPCVHDSDIYIDCPLCRITELEATIERLRDEVRERGKFIDELEEALGDKI